MAMTVDEYIEAKIRPEHKPIVARLRALMRECAPNATELITYGIIGWRGRKMLAVISPTKTDLTFAFSQGAEFEDKHDLLRGVGHVSKHVKLKSAETMPEAALRDYIAQALERDA